MDKRKVVLDTNVLVSALGWMGNPHRIMEMVTEGQQELFISYEQLEEISRVLDYPRFDFTKEQKTRFKALLLETATLVKPSLKLDVIKDDPTDNMILECAVAANADYIVSGDEHLLSIQSFGKVKILNPSLFLKEIGFSSL